MAPQTWNLAFRQQASVGLLAGLRWRWPATRLRCGRTTQMPARPEGGLIRRERITPTMPRRRGITPTATPVTTKAIARYSEAIQLNPNDSISHACLRASPTSGSATSTMRSPISTTSSGWARTPRTATSTVAMPMRESGILTTPLPTTPSRSASPLRLRLRAYFKRALACENRGDHKESPVRLHP